MSAKSNQYTQIIKKCLEQFQGRDASSSLDEGKTLLLSNMIQGRFLDHEVTKVCRASQISQKEQINQVGLKIMKRLEGFFADFRERINAKPSSIVEIAKATIAATSDFQMEMIMKSLRYQCRKSKNKFILKTGEDAYTALIQSKDSTLSGEG